MSDTPFHKIVSGQTPCYKLYEDEFVLAFLDIGPLSKGHTLVIPKVHVETLDKLSDEHAAAIGRVLPRLCRAVVHASGAHAFNVLQNNGARAHQAVPWVHFHIIPKFDHGSDDGLHIFWKPGKLDPKTAHELQEKVVAAMNAH
jgi:histidine triad (HIT) family protein